MFLYKQSFTSVFAAFIFDSIIPHRFNRLKSYRESCTKSTIYSFLKYPVNIKRFNKYLMGLRKTEQKRDDISLFCKVVS